MHNSCIFIAYLHKLPPVMHRGQVRSHFFLPVWQRGGKLRHNAQTE